LAPPPLAVGPSPTASTARRREAPTKRFPAAAASSSESLSRREWFSQAAAALAAGGVVVGGALVREKDKQNKQNSKKVGAAASALNRKAPSSTLSSSSSSASTKHLRPLNITQIAKETSVSLSVECLTGTTTIDTTTFQKKQAVRLPSWFPATLVPPAKVIKDIPDSELLLAAVLAGSTMDMLRTSVLYPVLTLKNRIQKDIKTHKFPPTDDNLLHLKRRLKVMQLNAQKHFEEGKLYRGIVPSLLKSAPATGVYYGTRDVMKRALHSSFLPHLSTVQISVIAALVADIFSLMVKTPADTLATRLQVAKVPTKAEIGAGQGPGDQEAVEEAIQAEVDAQVGNWFTESLERLPAIILTDLPYLLSRIAINQSLLNGNSIDIGRYEIMAITTALLCAFLTTPFDVARTRILIDSDNDPTNGIDGGSGEGLVRTFDKIMGEGDGGVRNLFAGWLERTLYLGVGRAWIEPFQMVGYAILRDMILLEWFD
jgi:Mitochondrial carrier protein